VAAVFGKEIDMFDFPFVELCQLIIPVKGKQNLEDFSMLFDVMEISSSVSSLHSDPKDWF